ncbi:MAG TPA: hypothetical protein VJV78_08955 [Polyangiales bacterium]|nr:hypothetical protein [Polyangiales bacterium]
MTYRNLFAIAVLAVAACGDGLREDGDAGPVSDGGGAGVNVYGESGAGGAGSKAAGSAGNVAAGTGGASGAIAGSSAGGRGGASGAAGMGGRAAGGGGGSSGAGGAAALPEYLVYGFVLGKPADCPEGYDVFDDTKYYYTLVTTGKSSTVKAELKQQMMTEHPGEREYNVLDSSFSYPTASHAVAIRYTSNVSPWNCRPKVVAIGLGKTYDEALARALEIKADNFSKNAPYEELKHITWQGK